VSPPTTDSRPLGLAERCCELESRVCPYALALAVISRAPMALQPRQPLGDGHTYAQLPEPASFRGWAQPTLRATRTPLAATDLMAVGVTIWHGPLFVMPVFGLSPIDALTTAAALVVGIRRRTTGPQPAEFKTQGD
jgi:hypothetical protein